MKKLEIVKKLAREKGVESGAAADELDRAVNHLVRRLRHGQAARLPGLGVIRPGKRWTFREEDHEEKP